MNTDTHFLVENTLVNDGEAILLSSHTDHQIRFNFSRNLLIAILLSLLIHVLFFVFIPKIQFNQSAKPLSTAIEVSLVSTKPAAKPVPVEKIEVPKLAPKPAPVKKNRPKAPKVITQKATKTPIFAVPDEPVTTPTPIETVAKETPTSNDVSEAPTDMASYVKAKQAQRQAAEIEAAKQNADAVAREIVPSDEEKRNARIKNNFQNGTNGIFEITSLNGRHAAFSFRGWTNDYSNARREAFEVEAKTGQDIRLVMIKRMISLIREHYQGDFYWESQRLGRIVMLSARVEDNASLEDFMMREFFGSNYKSSAW